MSQRSIIIKQLIALETDLPDSPPPPPSCTVNNICALDKYNFHFSSCNAGNDDDKKKHFLWTSAPPCEPERRMSDSASCFFFSFFFQIWRRFSQIVRQVEAKTEMKPHDEVLLSQMWQVIKNPRPSLTNTPFP